MPLPTSEQPKETVVVLSSAIIKIVLHSQDQAFIQNVFSSLQASNPEEAEQRLKQYVWLTLHKIQGVDIPPEVVGELTTLPFRQEVASRKSKLLEEDKITNNSQSFSHSDVYFSDDHEFAYLDNDNFAGGIDNQDYSFLKQSSYQHEFHFHEYPDQNPSEPRSKPDVQSNGNSISDSRHVSIREDENFLSDIQTETFTSLNTEQGSVYENYDACNINVFEHDVENLVSAVNHEVDYANEQDSNHLQIRNKEHGSSRNEEPGLLDLPNKCLEGNKLQEHSLQVTTENSCDHKSLGNFENTQKEITADVSLSIDNIMEMLAESLAEEPPNDLRDTVVQSLHTRNVKTDTTRALTEKWTNSNVEISLSLLSKHLNFPATTQESWKNKAYRNDICGEREDKDASCHIRQKKEKQQSIVCDKLSASFNTGSIIDVALAKLSQNLNPLKPGCLSTDLNADNELDDCERGNQSISLLKDIEANSVTGAAHLSLDVNSLSLDRIKGVTPTEKFYDNEAPNSEDSSAFKPPKRVLDEVYNGDIDYCSDKAILELSSSQKKRAPSHERENTEPLNSPVKADSHDCSDSMFVICEEDLDSDLNVSESFDEDEILELDDFENNYHIPDFHFKNRKGIGEKDTENGETALSKVIHVDLSMFNERRNGMVPNLPIQKNSANVDLVNIASHGSEVTNVDHGVPIKEHNFSGKEDKVASFGKDNFSSTLNSDTVSINENGAEVKMHASENAEGNSKWSPHTDETTRKEVNASVPTVSESSSSVAVADSSELVVEKTHTPNLRESSAVEPSENLDASSDLTLLCSLSGFDTDDITFSDLDSLSSLNDNYSGIDEQCNNTSQVKKNISNCKGNAETATEVSEKNYSEVVAPGEPLLASSPLVEVHSSKRLHTKPFSFDETFILASNTELSKAELHVKNMKECDEQASDESRSTKTEDDDDNENSQSLLKDIVANSEQDLALPLGYQAICSPSCMEKKLFLRYSQEDCKRQKTHSTEICNTVKNSEGALAPLMESTSVSCENTLSEKSKFTCEEELVDHEDKGKSQLYHEVGCESATKAIPLVNVEKERTIQCTELCLVNKDQNDLHEENIAEHVNGQHGKGIVLPLEDVDPGKITRLDSAKEKKPLSFKRELCFDKLLDERLEGNMISNNTDNTFRKAFSDTETSQNDMVFNNESSTERMCKSVTRTKHIDVSIHNENSALGNNLCEKNADESCSLSSSSILESYHLSPTNINCVNKDSSISRQLTHSQHSDQRDSFGNVGNDKSHTNSLGGLLKNSKMNDEILVDHNESNPFSVKSPLSVSHDMVSHFGNEAKEERKLVKEPKTQNSSETHVSMSSVKLSSFVNSIDSGSSNGECEAGDCQQLEEIEDEKTDEPDCPETFQKGFTCTGHLKLCADFSQCNGCSRKIFQPEKVTITSLHGDAQALNKTEDMQPVINQDFLEDLISEYIPVSFTQSGDILKDSLLSNIDSLVQSAFPESLVADDSDSDYPFLWDESTKDSNDVSKMSANDNTEENDALLSDGEHKILNSDPNNDKRPEAFQAGTKPLDVLSQTVSDTKISVTLNEKTNLRAEYKSALRIKPKSTSVTGTKTDGKEQSSKSIVIHTRCNSPMKDKCSKDSNVSETSHDKNSGIWHGEPKVKVTVSNLNQAACSRREHTPSDGISGELVSRNTSLKNNTLVTVNNVPMASVEENSDIEVMEWEETRNQISLTMVIEADDEAPYELIHNSFVYDEIEPMDWE